MQARAEFYLVTNILPAQDQFYQWLMQVGNALREEKGTLPTKLVQTTWNVEGEKTRCASSDASRHREVKRCMGKGVILLQEMRSDVVDHASWGQAFPNANLIATEGRVQMCSTMAPKAARVGGYCLGDFSLWQPPLGSCPSSTYRS